MKIYLCVKVGTQDDGDSVVVQTEGAFLDKAKAEKFFADKSKSWKEIIDNVVYNCVRALHETDIFE